MRLVLLYIDPGSSLSTGKPGPPALLTMPTTTRGAIPHEHARVKKAKLTRFLGEPISLLLLPGVSDAAAAGLAAEVLLERIENRPGQANVRPYAILARGWRYSEDVLQAVVRGAMLASKALQKAAEADEVEAPDDDAMDEEETERWTPPPPDEATENPFATAWDAEYELLEPSLGVKTGLEVILGTGGNLTQVYLANFPGMDAKDPRLLAIRPTGEVTQAYEDNLARCLELAFAQAAPEATMAWVSLDSSQYVERVRWHDMEQTKRLWITAPIALRQSEVVDMLLDVVTIAPAGLVPATFTCPTNGARLHVMECVWAADGPKQEVLEHGPLTLRYRKTLSQAEMLATQVSGPEAMAAVVFPHAESNAREKPWVLATHIVTQRWLFASWPIASELQASQNKGRHMPVPKPDWAAFKTGRGDVLLPTDSTQARAIMAADLLREEYEATLDNQRAKAVEAAANWASEGTTLLAVASAAMRQRLDRTNVLKVTDPPPRPTPPLPRLTYDLPGDGGERAGGAEGRGRPHEDSSCIDTALLRAGGPASPVPSTGHVHDAREPGRNRQWPHQDPAGAARGHRQRDLYCAHGRVTSRVRHQGRHGRGIGPTDSRIGRVRHQGGQDTGQGRGSTSLCAAIPWEEAGADRRGVADRMRASLPRRRVRPHHLVSLRNLCSPMIALWVRFPSFCRMRMPLMDLIRDECGLSPPQAARLLRETVLPSKLAPPSPCRTESDSGWRMAVAGGQATSGQPALYNGPRTALVECARARARSATQRETACLVTTNTDNGPPVAVGTRGPGAYPAKSPHFPGGGASGRLYTPPGTSTGGNRLRPEPGGRRALPTYTTTHGTADQVDPTRIAPGR